MSRKNTHLFKFWNEQSLTDDAFSTPTNILNVDNIGLQLIVTTTANNGLFTVQVSNDNVNWSDITLNPSIDALASSNIPITVNLNQLPFAWLRVKFAKGSTHTNGTVTGYLSLKMI